MLITDDDTSKADLCGDGKQRPVRNFARELRTKVWEKIFGITSGVRPASGLADAIKKPGAQASWEKIQEVATANTAIYEAAFDFIPRNKEVYFDKVKQQNIAGSASIWPTWDKAKVDKKNNPIIGSDGKAAKQISMPFDKEFWSEKRFVQTAVAALNGLQGFITLLPIEWTKGQNNNMGFNHVLIGAIEPKKDTEHVALNENTAKTIEDKT